MSVKLILHLLVVSVSCVLSIAVQAAPLLVAKGDSEKGEPEKLIVHGEKELERSNRADINLEQYSGFEKVISKSDFEDRLVSLEELIDTMAGIQVRNSGGAGGFSSVSIRGSSSKQVNLFVDGMLMNSAQSGVSTMAQLPTSLIESVEAFPDFTPVELGNASLAGAINIKTLDSFSGNGGRLSAGYGSFSSHKADLSAWYDYKDWSILLSVGNQGSDNDFNVEDVNDRVGNQFNKENRLRENAGFDQQQFYSKISRQSEVGINFQWFIQWVDTDKDLPTTRNKTSDNASLGRDLLLSQWRIDHKVGSFKLYHHVGYNQQSGRFKDLDGTFGNGKSKLLDDSETGLSLSNGVVYALAEHRLTASLEWSRNRYHQDNEIENARDIETQRDSVILALQDSWEPAERWQVNGIWRYYYSEDEVSNARTSSTQASGAVTRNVNEPAIQFGVKYSVTDWLELRTNIGRLLRQPTLAERFARRGEMEGTEELRSEQAVSYDLGVAVDTELLDLALAYFYRDAEDGIHIFYDSRGVAHPENISESYTKGIEVQATVPLPKYFKVVLAATYMDSENQSEIKGFKGKKLPGLYHESTRVGLRWERAQFSANAAYVIEDELYYDPAHAAKADRVENLEFGIAYSYAPFTIDLSVRNLQDKNYQDFNRMPASGRSAFLTMNIDF